MTTPDIEQLARESVNGIIFASGFQRRNAEKHVALIIERAIAPLHQELEAMRELIVADHALAEIVELRKDKERLRHELERLHDIVSDVDAESIRNVMNVTEKRSA